jgi:regulatory protein
MKKTHRRFRPPTPESLAKAALVYLGRFAASETSLRRVLENRIRRAALHNDLFAKDTEAQERLRAAIGALVEKYRKTGVLNDAAYAEIKTHSLRRAGRSARAIRQKLGHAGVGEGLIARALADIGEEGDAELKAARELARRRRLGPFRAGASDIARGQKDLAVLARAGFTLDIARKALRKTDES